jgi:hypothetical protein
MWLYTQSGFVSVVQHSRKHDHVVVRARSVQHIQELQRRYPLWLAGVAPLQDDDADYRYRITVPKAMWAGAAQAMMLDIDYTNFKAKMSNSDHVSLLHDIWERTKRCFAR